MWLESRKNPVPRGGFLAKIDERLIAAQDKDYPFDKCIVSNEGLGTMGDPIVKLYGTSLVKFCCKGCIKSFEKRPENFLAKLHEARMKKEG